MKNNHNNNNLAAVLVVGLLGLFALEIKINRFVLFYKFYFIRVSVYVHYYCVNGFIRIYSVQDSNYKFWLIKIKRCTETINKYEYKQNTKQTSGNVLKLTNTWCESIDKRGKLLLFIIFRPFTSRCTIGFLEPVRPRTRGRLLATILSLIRSINLGDLKYEFAKCLFS